LTSEAARQYIDFVPGPSNDFDSTQTVAGLMRLTNTLTRRLGPLFQKSRVTPQQWMLLSALAESDAPPTLAGLSRKLLVSKQNVTGMVRRLEDLALIKRSDDPADLRSNRIALTRRGSDVVDRIGPVYRDWVEELFGRLSAADRKQLERAVSTLTVALSDLD